MCVCVCVKVQNWQGTMVIEERHPNPFFIGGCMYVCVQLIVGESKDWFLHMGFKFKALVGT
jgi:hypothetical protein